MLNPWKTDALQRLENTLKIRKRRRIGLLFWGFLFSTIVCVIFLQLGGACVTMVARSFEGPSDVYNRGVAHLNRGEYDNAISEFSRIMSMSPVSSDAYCARGVCYLRKDDYLWALRDFDVALNLNPKNETANYNLAICCRKLVEQVTRSLARDGLISAQGKLKGYIRSLEKGEYPPEALNSLAWFLVSGPTEIRDARVALRLAEKATTKDSERWNFQGTLGVAQYRCGHYSAALATLTKADELYNRDHAGRIQSAHHPVHVATIAMSLFQTGRNEDARGYFRQLQTLMKDPSNANDPDTRTLAEEAESLLGLGG